MQQLVNYALSCTRPGLQYFAAQLESSLSGSLTATFKAVRIANPQKVAEMMPTAIHVDILHSFPFVTDLMLGHIKGKLPDYVVKVTDTGPKFCPLKWWPNNCTSLPFWAALARKILLHVVQPSSAAAER